MHSVMRRFMHLFIVIAGIACSWPALGAYVFTSVDYPDADALFTNLWGVNNSGQVVGDSKFVLDENLPTEHTMTRGFVYDLKKRVFRDLPTAPGATDSSAAGINDTGVVVGNAYLGPYNPPPPIGDGSATPPQNGFILDKSGMFTQFSDTSSGYPRTEARGVSASGLVTGSADEIGGNPRVGFIYNPVSHGFTNFLPSLQTIAQGINSLGQVVGSARFANPGTDPCTTSTCTYGFVRDTHGAVTLFRVNGSQTRARGITDSGRIAGFFTDGQGTSHGYVGSLAGLPASGQNIPDVALLDVPFQNAINTSAQAINNSGIIVGSWDEFVGLDGNGDAIIESHGFIAVPIAASKDQCKNDGWQWVSRADGTFFKNQGDCIQYVNTGK